MYVFVISSTGIPLMPTYPCRARRLLRSGKAVIHRHDPFTIRLTERESGDVQPVEYKCDTGYQHIGISICSEKHEYVNEQRDLLTDETERHNDRRKYRRNRRGRKRYRKPRFDNRKKKAGMSGKWFAPSIDNKLEQHVMLYRRYLEVLPITDAVFEMGNFDTQLLKAIEEGCPLPQGEDYQHGERYGIETLREAVFTRDGHRCVVCDRGIEDNAIFHVHHIGFWKGDRTDRMANLATVCEKCHTPKNHKPGGKLYGLEPKLKPFTGATFMTSVRWEIYKMVKAADAEVHVRTSYGAETKLSRKDLSLKKTHANDAYAMGDFHPVHRTDHHHYKKLRRNNRILDKFYDAVYIDTRDGKKKKGVQLGCNRIKRSEPRMSDKNERIFRGEKVKPGRRSIRRRRYSIRPGTLLKTECGTIRAKGVHCGGTRVILDNGKSVAISKVIVKKFAGGWKLLA